PEGIARAAVPPAGERQAPPRGAATVRGHPARLRPPRAAAWRCRMCACARSTASKISRVSSTSVWSISSPPRYAGRSTRSPWRGAPGGASTVAPRSAPPGPGTRSPERRLSLAFWDAGRLLALTEVLADLDREHRDLRQQVEFLPGADVARVAVELPFLDEERAEPRDRVVVVLDRAEQLREVR